MIERLKGFAKEAGDSEDIEFRKILILLIASACCVCGIAWSLLYVFVFGFGLSALLPFLFVVIVGVAIAIAHATKKYMILVYVQLTCITWISALLQWSIGTIDQSGFVTAWSFLGPIGALIFLPRRKAFFWMAQFLIIIVASAVFEPVIGEKHYVSDEIRAVFYIMNIATPLTVAFSASAWFANTIQNEKKRSDNLLLNILPAEVASELKADGKVVPKYLEHATVIFSDFKGFTQLSESLPADEIVNELNFCFSAFDEITSKYNIEKIKTIGDSYMAIGGGINNRDCPPCNVVKAGLEMQEFIINRKKTREQQGFKGFEMRVGINSGHLVAGVVGVKKFQYDVWGDTVNIASRMESSGEVGRVNISGVTYDLIKDKFVCQYRGKLPAKGKGDMDMYFVLDRNSSKSINESKDFLAATNYILTKLKNELPKTLFYHGVHHTNDVHDTALSLAKQEAVNDSDIELLEIATLFHDSGYTVQAHGHEQIGCGIAKDALPKFGYTEAEIEKICGMIMATKIPQSPKTKLEEIICDADLDYLGRDDFETVSESLYKELNHNKPISREQWLKLEIEFLEGHTYFTTTSRKLRNEKKAYYLKLLKDSLSNKTQ